LRQLQLTCGNPPPAADPSTLTIMAVPQNDNGGPPDRRLVRNLAGNQLAAVELGRGVAGNLQADLLLRHFRLVPFELHGCPPDFHPCQTIVASLPFQRQLCSDAALASISR
jgi:hypothetical protein